MKRGYLSAEQTVQSMPIILLPQRTGHLLLPVIEVKCYKAESLNTGVVPSDGTRVPCEVDNKTLAQSVHVVSGLRETVVEIEVDAEAEGQAANERRCWLAGSKNREASRTKQSR
jgi:Trafficking protein particle complex subunit 10, TRAPPC10